MGLMRLLLWGCQHGGFSFWIAWALRTGLPFPPSRSDAPTGSCATNFACHGAADALHEEDFCYAAEDIPCCAMSLRGTDADCTIS